MLSHEILELLMNSIYIKFFLRLYFAILFFRSLFLMPEYFDIYRSFTLITFANLNPFFDKFAL